MCVIPEDQRFDPDKSISTPLDLAAFDSCSEHRTHNVWNLMLRHRTSSHALQTRQVVRLIFCICSWTCTWHSNQRHDFEYLKRLRLGHSGSTSRSQGVSCHFQKNKNCRTHWTRHISTRVDGFVIGHDYCLEAYHLFAGQLASLTPAWSF